jgi:RES domain-containing protein
VTRLIALERVESLTAWRITRAEFAASALSGQGGRYADGRWHRAGQPVVYLACTWSLAALEVLVHLGRRDTAIPFVYFSVTIPPQASALTVETDTLPPEWISEPPLPDTQRLGTDWLRAGASALLRVPSVLSPVESEYNWILNPQHPDAATLIVSDPRPFQFDRRLRKERP